MSYGFIIDMEKCIGCHGCSVTCKAANGTPPGVTRSHVLRSYEGTYPDVHRIIRPVMCNHCENPLCVPVCPIDGATYRREDGIVVIDKELCDGCGHCIEACPYGARYAISSPDGYFGAQLSPYEEVAYVGKEEGTVDKCDFCLEYSGGADPNPVCVKACQVEARIFGELDALQGMIAARGGATYLPEEGTSPVVFYLPVVDNK